METTRTEKTYLIKAIWNWLQKIVRIESKSSVFVFTFIGIAAYNINEIIIHLIIDILIIIKKNFNINNK